MHYKRYLIYHIRQLFWHTCHLIFNVASLEHWQHLYARTGCAERRRKGINM